MSGLSRLCLFQDAANLSPLGEGFFIGKMGSYATARRPFREGKTDLPLNDSAKSKRRRNTMEQSLRHLIEPGGSLLRKLRADPIGQENVREHASLWLTLQGKDPCDLGSEPSTRTQPKPKQQCSVWGIILGFSDAETSSVKKGESLSDTMRCMSYYCDIAVMRHPREGAPNWLHSTQFPYQWRGRRHQHPTQTLTDLLTIRV